MLILPRILMRHGPPDPSHIKGPRRGPRRSIMAILCWFFEEESEIKQTFLLFQKNNDRSWTSHKRCLLTCDNLGFDPIRKHLVDLNPLSQKKNNLKSMISQMATSNTLLPT